MFIYYFLISNPTIRKIALANLNNMPDFILIHVIVYCIIGEYSHSLTSASYCSSGKLCIHT